LSGDELTYSLTPVDSLGALKTAIKIHGEQAGSIIFINCIGAYSLLEINIPEAVTAWVIESKRPIHLDNIYNSELIKIIAHNSEIAEWQIPDAMAIYDQEGSSDGENDDEDDAEDDYHTDDVDGEGSIEDDDDDDDADRTGEEDEVMVFIKQQNYKFLSVPREHITREKTQAEAPKSRWKSTKETQKERRISEYNRETRIKTSAKSPMETNKGDFAMGILYEGLG
jgi:hypothetical protein